ncbi:MAG: DUF1398 domain-containing protein [Alphaproteobacteria bacterium]|nr:DUF1398 domain-containing protein [Alphaproteobacteria bacterium]
MHAEATSAARACTAGSDEGRLTFPQVLGLLGRVGIERYHADLCRSEKTYYLSDGHTIVTPGAPLEVPPQARFSAAGVDRAVRDVQAGRLNYKQFCARIAAAGCVGYHVSLDGRRAVYYRRTAEMHVEMFPAAA